jgi:hypothetical protein
VSDFDVVGGGGTRVVFACSDGRVEVLDVKFGMVWGKN